MSIEAMKDALEALEWLTASNDLAQPEDIPKIVINLRTAIEAAENVQPYGWANLDEVTEQFNSVNCGTVYRLPGEDRSPLYTTPQEFVCSTGLCHYKAQRQWVGLMQGVRVVEDSVIIATKNNDTARQLCAELLRVKNTA